MPTRTRGIRRRNRSARRPKGDVRTESFSFPRNLNPPSFAGQFGLADGGYDERVAALEDAANTEAKYAKALELSGGEQALRKYTQMSSPAVHKHWEAVGRCSWNSREAELLCPSRGWMLSGNEERNIVELSWSSRSWQCA